MNDAPAWHVLGRVETSDTGEMHTDVQIPPESLWFSGHFPGEPVLPGIAQLGIAYDAVCQALGGQISITGFSRVKFKKMVRPLDCLKVFVTTQGGPAGRVCISHRRRRRSRLQRHHDAGETKRYS